MCFAKQVVGRIIAGVDPDSIAVSAGQCAYITTGAKLPKGADAVVKVEDTAAVDGDDASTFNAEEKSVRILKGVRTGQSIRPVGFDIVEGATVMKAGERIGAAEVRAAIVAVVDVVVGSAVGVVVSTLQYSKGATVHTWPADLCEYVEN